MRIPKIYRRDMTVDPSIKETHLDLDMPEVVYTPDVDIDDDKSVSKYVRTVKAAIRSSSEYKKLISFLKEKCCMNKCFYLPKVKKWRDSKVVIEIHHTGLVMEDIVTAVLRRRYVEGEDYDVQSIAEEVMLEHYYGHISLTALSSTMHSLIHEEDSGLFIPLQMVDIGNSNIFYEKYKEWIPKETRQKYEQYQILSNAIVKIDDIIPDYLDRNYVFYKKDGIEIPDMNKIMEIVNLN